MSYADQSPFRARCEWGQAALEHLKPAEIVVIVDVLSFSTCVEIGASRGATIFPWAWKDKSAHEYARAIHAELAGSREGKDSGKYSLSPSSLVSAEPALRLVLPSPNGSTLSQRAKDTGATIVAGCLRNASVIGAWLRSQDKSVTVIPAGERWPDGSIRHALEDLIGAGAILSHIDASLSPEARLAVAAYKEFRPTLTQTLLECTSGRELVERGFQGDVELAAALDAGASVPILSDGGFQALPCAKDILTIRGAASEDTAAIVHLLQEAACWLQGQGRPLWKPEDFTIDGIRREVPAWFLAIAGTEAAGVFKLEDEDSFFWPDVPKGESLFLHKLVVSRAHAGKGLSSAMLAHAVEQARVHGKPWLRLDCDATRPKLRRVYETFGFQLHSEREIGGYRAARYEYPVSPPQ